MISPEDEPLWPDIAFRMLTNTVSHPIEYAKVLIQIGYEPIPPRPTTTLFGQPALALPNIFQYVRHERKNCIYQFIRDLISRTIGIILSHPLDVIALRMMAQFVGAERKYNGLFRSFVEVYKENGIMGYYAGLVPRLIGNAAALLLVSSSTYVIDKYVISDRALKPFVVSIMRFAATTITYPFLVVSHCMAVNNCGLIAGLPPQMPIYNNWLDCWSHLSATNQLKRGNSLLWRYYTGPQVIINGKPIPLNKYNFQLQSTT
nr:PREDICTED: mitochondrial carrier homolog 2-like isoform X2 [Megachile rotundata]